MNFKKIKIFHLFWIVSVLILLIGLSEINNQDNTFDVNIHDTYFVIPNYYGTVVMFLFYFLMGIGYWLVQEIFQKQLIKTLTIIHSIILIGSFIFYQSIVYYNKTFVRDYFYIDDNYQLINTTLIIESLLIVFIAMPVYIINLLIAIFRKI